MTQTLQPKRLTCPRCMRPQRTCICEWITPIEHAVEVIVLQHPMEVDHAKGSARLLHLSLPNSRLIAGEVFAEQTLRALINAPLHHQCVDTAAIERAAKYTVLLYPETPDGNAMHAPSPVLERGALGLPSQVRLIVLDGTWRKSRKMLYRNPLLQGLPRLPLQGAPPSQYRIRKAHRPDQLSTLEATCYALMHLEQDEAKYQPLLKAFEGFVTQQFGYRSAP